MSDRVEAPIAFKIGAFALFLTGVAGLVLMNQNGRLDWNRDRRNARVNAQVIGEHLIKHKFMIKTFPTEAPDSTRTLASGSQDPSLVQKSEGEIGRDPWGVPFRFKKVQGAERKRYVLVWSAGVNHKYDSDPASSTTASKARDFLNGDDVGTLLPIPTEN